MHRTSAGRSRCPGRTMTFSTKTGMRRFLTSTGSRLSSTSTSPSSRGRGCRRRRLLALLLRLALTVRMANYAESVAKPSPGGLKLDLDRFRRDVEVIIHETKKSPISSLRGLGRRSQRPHRRTARAERGGDAATHRRRSMLTLIALIDGAAKIISVERPRPAGTR